MDVTGEIILLRNHVFGKTRVRIMHADFRRHDKRDRHFSVSDGLEKSRERVRNVALDGLPGNKAGDVSDPMM